MVRWVADTGASEHCAPDGTELRELSQPIRMFTANGPVDVTRGWDTSIEGLGKIETLCMDDCPFLLSIGRLIENGFNFYWDKNTCKLSNTEEKWSFILQIENHVPILYVPTFVTGRLAHVMNKSNDFNDHEVLKSILDEI